MQADENIEKIKMKVESAFNPFRCVAEVWDYEQKLRFKVVDNDGRIIMEMPQISVRELMNDNYLQDLIEQARAQIRMQRPDFL